MTVRDNGMGLPQDFNAATSGTLGLQLVSVLAKQLRGTFHMNSHCGTEAIVTFPKEGMNSGQRTKLKLIEYQIEMQLDHCLKPQNLPASDVD